MANVPVLDVAGKKVGTRELSELFEGEVNVPLMHQVVVAGMAAIRRHALDQDPGRRLGRRAQALASEGDRPLPAGLEPLAAVGRRWSGPRAASP